MDHYSIVSASATLNLSPCFYYSGIHKTKGFAKPNSVAFRIQDVKRQSAAYFREYWTNHHVLWLCASSNPPSVLCGIPLSGQPEQMQDPYALFGLAPLGSAFSFQLYEPQAIHHHHYP